MNGHQRHARPRNRLEGLALGDGVMLDGAGKGDPHGSVINRVRSEGHIELPLKAPSKVNPEWCAIQGSKTLTPLGEDRSKGENRA